MIPHVEHREFMTPDKVNAVEAALGLPLTPPTGRGTLRDLWDPIAHETGLPDSDALQASMDGPGIDVIPHWLWNAAVDIANRRR